MGSGEVQRQLPGKSEETDRDQARGRGSRGGREAEETGSRHRLDGRSQAEPGADGRQEETRGHGQVRGTARRGWGQVPARTVSRASGLGLRAVSTVAFSMCLLPRYAHIGDSRNHPTCSVIRASQKAYLAEARSPKPGARPPKPEPLAQIVASR